MKGWFQGALRPGLVGIFCFAVGTSFLIGVVVPAVSSPSSPAQAVANRDANLQILQRLQRDRLSRIIGLRVENRDGGYVGRVADVVVDLKSGDIPYVLVASGGLLTLGVIERPVPATALSMGTIKKGVLAVDLSEARWEHAPSLKRAALASLSRPERMRAIYQFYRKPLPQGATSVGPELIASGASLTPTGRSETGGQQTPATALASALIGREVASLEGQAVGRMSDLLIELGSDKPALAVVEGGRLLRREGIFMLPLHSLSSAATPALIANVNRGAFEQAPEFSEHAWKAASRFVTAVYHCPEPHTELELDRNASAPSQPGEFARGGVACPWYGQNHGGNPERIASAFHHFALMILPS
jgi:sporulation protein YlmC with PRC-barrel domain